jgi:nucleoside-diphosphate-sugar epimerase
MKIVVIGGTGLIGSRVVTKLAEHDHEAVGPSPASGVKTLSGEGLDLVPEDDALPGSTRLEDWLRHSADVRR